MFFRKKPSTNDAFARIHTDMHSHFLPGIDDGAPDMETSLRIISGMQKLGYKKLIATPHIFKEYFPNSPDIILSKLAAVKKAAAEAGIDIELDAGAEYYLDDHVEQLLKSKEKLLCISDNKVLVEFSMLMQPMNLTLLIFELQVQGYHPVIAHPERYSYLVNDKDFYRQLREMGCLFQLNMLSPTGHYGRTVKELSLWLIKNNYYDLVGTDLHHLQHLAALEKLSGNFFDSYISKIQLINDQL